jgi:hypothetical protein
MRSGRVSGILKEAFSNPPAPRWVPDAPYRASGYTDGYYFVGWHAGKLDKLPHIKVCAGFVQVVYGECFVATVVLICAIFASLAGGVLLAYSLCNAMFNLFRIHSIQVAQQRIALREAQHMATAPMDAAL